MCRRKRESERERKREREIERDRESDREIEKEEGGNINFALAGQKHSRRRVGT